MALMQADQRILSVSDGVPADPFVGLNELRDSSVQFVMKAWVKSSDYWDVRYDMNEKIYRTLPENDVNFPFPQLDVTIKNS